jgi:hypothetical protein
MNPNFDFFLTAKIKLGNMESACAGVGVRQDRGTVYGLLVTALEQETGKKVKGIKFDMVSGIGGMNNTLDGITVTFDQENA